MEAAACNISVTGYGSTSVLSSSTRLSIRRSAVTEDQMNEERADESGRFDFRLSTEQEARANRLHTASIVFDLLSQHAGGQIFAHYPAALQRELEHKMAAA